MNRSDVHSSTGNAVGAHTEDRILRQVLGNRLAHWLVALSTFALIFSGFGQMPMYGRYGLSKLPGMAWTADFGLQLSLHYIGAFVLVFGIVFHVVFSLARGSFTILPRRGDIRESAQIIAAMLGRGTEPVSHKYLAEQRLAYAFIGVNLIVVVVSGVLKVVKNLPGTEVPYWLIFTSTTAHNIAAILLLAGIAGHLLAFVFKANRKLLPAMLSGYIDAGYARERHELWYREVVSARAGAERSARPADASAGRDAA